MIDQNPAMISVIISTRNRGNEVILAVESILNNRYPSFEIVIVDQSDGEDTVVALRPFAQDARIVCVRSPEVGISSGRNRGVRMSKGTLIAITDDDCEVAPDWLPKLVAAFEVDTRVGVVFGTTAAGEHAAEQGLIPAYGVSRPFLARRLRDKPGGMGACMAFRRDVWERLNGFDQRLGVGAAFLAGEDTDFTARALLAGYFVYETPDVRVIHHGFRQLEEAGALTFSYWYGTGAALTKILKCGHLSVLGYLFRLAWSWIFHESSIATSFGLHSSRWSRLTAFVRGMSRAAVTPVERASGHFR